MHKIKTLYYIFNTVGFLGSIGLVYFISWKFVWLLTPLLLIAFIGMYDLLQTQHTLLRNFPVIGAF